MTRPGSGCVHPGSLGATATDPQSRLWGAGACMPPLSRVQAKCGRVPCSEDDEEICQVAGGARASGALVLSFVTRVGE